MFIYYHFYYSGHKQLASKSEFFLTETSNYSVGYHGYLSRYVLAKTILSEEDKALTDNVSLLERWISMSHALTVKELYPEYYNIWLEISQRVYQINFITQKFESAFASLICGMAWIKSSSMTPSVISCASTDAQLMSVVNIRVRLWGRSRA